MKLGKLAWLVAELAQLIHWLYLSPPPPSINDKVRGNLKDFLMGWGVGVEITLCSWLSLPVLLFLSRSVLGQVSLPLGVLASFLCTKDFN